MLHTTPTSTSSGLFRTSNAARRHEIFGGAGGIRPQQRRRIWQPTLHRGETCLDPYSLLKNVYQEIWAVDPHVTFSASGSIKDLLREENQFPLFDSITLSSFAGIGLLLVVIGIFSVMTYTVSLQTSEIGIRMALGAQQSAILGRVLRKGVGLIVAGTFIGLFVSFGLTR